MAFDTDPAPEYIHKFAERMESVWGAQKKCDDEAYELYRKKSLLEIAEPKDDAGRVEVRPLRTGLPGRIIDQDVAILAQPPTFRVNPPVSKKRQHILEEHASGKLEPWLNAAFDESQSEQVWLQQVRDLRLYGRGWSNVFVLPRLWAGSDYRELADALISALQSGDEDRIAFARETIEEYKRNNFPIRWQYADARSTWHQVSTERRLPEVIEIREQSAADIAADFGPDILPHKVDEQSDATLRVFVYTNWLYTATAVEHSEKLAHYWKHDLGMNPYILLETPPQPRGNNIRWKSALYDHADVFNTEDEILSDLRHNHRRNTLAGHLFKLNPDVRMSNTPDTSAVPGEVLDYEPGGDIVLWRDEDAGLMPAPIINPQSMQLLEFVNNFTNSIALNPVEYGRLLSGVSAVGFTTALQAAQRRLDPIARAIERATREWAKLMFRNVQRLSKEFPDAPDVVYVFRAGGEALGVSPADVDGQEALVQPRLSNLLPINDNLMMALAKAASQLNVPPDFILEHYLNIEDPGNVLARWEKWKIREALLADKIEKARALATELSQQFPQAETTDLAARIANLPVAVQMGLAAAGALPTPGGAPGAAIPGVPEGMGGGPPGMASGVPGTAPGSPGAMSQAMSNVRRTGTPQAPSEGVIVRNPQPGGPIA